jgi:membrane associated rhomboid family serine protease
MLPLQDVIPSRTRPWVTIGLIATNAAVLVVEWALPDRTRMDLLLGAGLIPARASWLTATTAIFLHANVLQAAGNLGALWIFGENVEDRLGHLRYLIFYLLAGYAGAALRVWTAPASLAPGGSASAAVAGIVAAYLVTFPQSRVLVLVPVWLAIDLVEVPATLIVVVWGFTQMFSGVGRWAPASAEVLLAAPAGGFVAGLALVWFFRRPERQHVEWWGEPTSRPSAESRSTRSPAP